MQKGFEVVNLHGTASGVIAVPVIGENGNWWIGNEDTGIKAQGEPGEPGPQGEKGEAGVPGVDPAELERLREEVEVLKCNLEYIANPEFDLLFTGTLTIPPNSSGTLTCEVSNSIIDYRFIFISMSKATGSGVSFIPTAYIDTSYPTGSGDNVIYSNFVSHSDATGVFVMARVVSATSIIASGREYGWAGADNFDVKIYGIGRRK